MSFIELDDAHARKACIRPTYLAILPTLTAATLCRNRSAPFFNALLANGRVILTYGVGWQKPTRARLILASHVRRIDEPYEQFLSSLSAPEKATGHTPST
jgi:hypothetical protein